MKEDIVVGLFFVLGAQVPWIVIFYVIWSAGFL